MIKSTVSDTSLASLQLLVDEWRLKGEKIVFTNGCYDLLHKAHIQSLEDAKSLGDRLIVGLNSDSSIRALKGDQRPIVGEADRRYILSRLQMVDAVLLFDEINPVEIIRALRPDIYAKGGDYTLDTLPNAHEIVNYAKEIIITPTYAYKSTSQWIQKIKAL